ncbi:MAG TPA: NUDIX domain-containing protein [Herpetosiphonaceae bacterium]
MLHEVVGAVIAREGRLLLALRSQGRSWCPGVWDVPGGHLEPGESPERCLARELGEELGIAPTRWAYLETIRDDDEDLDCRFYLVLEWQGAPQNLQPAEHDALEWLTPEEAAGRELAHPSYPALFARALAAAAAMG